jgi:hypothetical protein
MRQSNQVEVPPAQESATVKVAPQSGPSSVCATLAMTTGSAVVSQIPVGPREFEELAGGAILDLRQCADARLSWAVSI